MRARHRRLLWAAGLVAAVIGGVSLSYVFATNSVRGRRWLRSVVETQASNVFGGRATLKIGTLHDISLTHLSASDVSLLDSAGVAVVHADSLAGDVSLSGILFDTAIHITALTLRGVRMDLRQDFVGPWNIAHIISGGTDTLPPGPPGYGDNIRIDALRINDLAITTVVPWAPHPVFTGSARDSVIAVRDSLHDITRTPKGLLERRRYDFARIVARDAIITQPSKAQSSMQVDTLRGTVTDPPVRLVHAAGEIRWMPDSMRLALPVVKLPASTGSAEGKLSWHDKGPLRYDILVKANAGLSDLGWIWDVLPETGNGSADVRMRTLDDPYDTEYALTKLDVRASDSHVTGAISVIVRPAELVLHDVDLAFTPLQVELARRLSYDAIPAAVRGTIEGTLVAKGGGPLAAFTIDAMNARFTDARFSNAVSSLSLSGTVGIGAEPTGRDLLVRDLSLDLRSAQAIDSTLPALDGVLRGNARIATASLERANVPTFALFWTDAMGNRSSVSGSAQVGYGPRSSALVTALTFDPLSMKALARLDTTLAIRADVAGTVRTTGTLDALTWEAKLGAVGDGALDLAGTASLTNAAWRVTAGGTADGLNARAWTEQAATPVTAISGAVRLAADGSRAADGAVALGTASGKVDLSQPAAADRPAFALQAQASLDGERLVVDSANASIGGVAFDARGTLARTAGSGVGLADTLQVSVRADTLANVRAELTRVAAMFASMDSSTAQSMRDVAADTLLGEASVSGYLVGSLDDFSATFALAARAVQVGSIRVGRIFGSLQADSVLTKTTFAGAATADAVDGIGAIRIATADFKVSNANPDSGRLTLDVSSRDDAHLVLRGGFTRDSSAFDVALDSLRFSYDSATWTNTAPIRVRSNAQGIRVDSLDIRSNVGGAVGLAAQIPMEGPVVAALRLDRFPIGEAATFALGTAPFDGSITGEAQLSGTRAAPLLSWQLRAEQLGVEGAHLPPVTSDGTYADRKLVARARLADSLGGALHAEARVPIDLALRAMDKRTLSDVVDAEVVADSLRLEALGIAIDGVSRAQGTVQGRLAIAGTTDRPVATGTMALERFSAVLGTLGIAPADGRLVLRAAQDSLILETLRLRSGGPSDTLSARGAMRFASGEPATVRLQLNASNVVLARQSDGTDLELSGRVEAVGPLKRPELSGSLFVPRANLVIDPLGASTALDLSSAAARELLGAEEVPVAESAAQSMARLGQYLTVANARVDLGDEVWVQTPESRVKIGGGLAVTMSGDKLALEGEITANRGQYLLDLGVVNRSFAIDSGVVRFFGSDAIAPTLDISATNVVRVASGDETPVRVHIGGTLDLPVISLSSSDPLFSSAPESEIISLLIFGAPTFALDGQSQSTVRAVTGVLLPSAGGFVEGALQRLLPFNFNTLQVNTAGGQGTDDLTALSLLDNLSITAGKQLGDRTFLRVNTGLCRASGQGASPWFGLSAEFRVARSLTAQVGVDPGASPCTQLGGSVIPRMQFGFDLFREWIF